MKIIGKIINIFSEGEPRPTHILGASHSLRAAGDECRAPRPCEVRAQHAVPPFIEKLLIFLVVLIVPVVNWASTNVFEKSPTFIDQKPFLMKEPILCGYLDLRRGCKAIFENRFNNIASADQSLFKAAFDLAQEQRCNFEENFKADGNAYIAGAVSTNSHSMKTMITEIHGLFEREKFEPDGAFFYFFDNLNTYIFVITGKIFWKLWKPLYKEGMIENRRDGFTVIGRKSIVKPTSPVIRFGNGYLVVCPLELEPDIDILLKGNQIQLSSKWSTFLKMLELKPILAIEGDIGPYLKMKRDEFGGTLFSLPFPLNEIKLVRLIVSPAIMKAQFFSESENARQSIAKMADSFIDYLKSIIQSGLREGKIFQFSLSGNSSEIFQEFETSLKSYCTKNSIFIEASGLREVSNFLGIAEIGFLSGFMASTAEKIKSTVEEENNQDNPIYLISER